MPVLTQPLIWQLYTVLLYLNDCAEGGATQLLRAEQCDATELDATGAKVAKADHVAHAVRPQATAFATRAAPCSSAEELYSRLPAEELRTARARAVEQPSRPPTRC